MTLTMTSAVACMVLYGVLTSLWWLCVPMVLHAVVDAITMPATQLAVGYASGEGALAAGQGLFGATGLAVAALASVGAGVLYEGLGAAGVWWASAGAMVVCIVLARLQGKGHDWSSEAAGRVG